MGRKGLKPIDLDRGVYSPEALKTKTGDDRLRALHPHAIEALRPIEGQPGEFVFDTSNREKIFRRACLDLKLGRYVWMRGDCKGEIEAPMKVKEPLVGSNHDCPSEGAGLHYRYRALTLHGFRRSCVNYYRERCGHYEDHPGTKASKFSVVITLLICARRKK